ncbi:MAG: prepilin-type N-terminal cleavage/methylation domain-containing protein [Rickettsiales bacterium]|nr:prepilin-type N-terminal cleavage/methylation domain-containing protein [Rickettsiales bacterium]
MNKNRNIHSAFSLIELSIVILIIGILIAGITQGSALISKFRLATAKAVTQSSPVNSIKNLILWLEPTTDDSFTNASSSKEVSDGDLISSWNDINPQATFKTNFTQATADNQPTYKTKGINGIPSLSFNGTSSMLNSTSTLIPNGASSYTIFIVFQSTSLATQVIFAQNGVNCTGEYVGVFTTSLRVNGWGCGTFGDTDAFSFRLNTPTFVAYRVDGSQTNNVLIYSNNNSYGPFARALSVNGVNMVIGAGNRNPYLYWLNGFLSEIIIFDRALKTDEITSIRDYLIKKYSITS